MLLAIKIAFCLDVAGIVMDIGVLDGAVSYIVGAVLVAGALALFNAGCRVAAGRAAQRAYDQGEQRGAQNALVRVRDRALADLATGDLPPPEAR